MSANKHLSQIDMAVPPTEDNHVVRLTELTGAISTKLDKTAIVSMSYAEFDSLPVKDQNTVYIVPDYPNGSNVITNPLLAAKPHLWVTGVEYDFGDGSFGQRFKNTITAAANTRSEIVLIANGIKTIENSNIMFQISSGDNWYSAGYPATTFPNTVSGGVQVSAAGALVLGTIYSSARTNAPYDVWVLYTKAVT